MATPPSKSAAWRQALTFWTERWRDFGDSQLRLDDFAHRCTAGGRTFAAAQQAVAFDRHEFQKMRRLALRQASTLHAVMLAVFVRVLHLCTGRQRVAVWGQFANRSSIEMETVIGWLANTHLLGFRCSSAMQLEELITQAGEVLRGAMRHQEVPRAYLWKAFTQQGRNIAPSDLFVSFDSQRIDNDECRRFEEIRLPAIRAVTGIKAIVLCHHDTMSLIVTYSRDAFESASVGTVTEGMKSIIDAIP